MSESILWFNIKSGGKSMYCKTIIKMEKKIISQLFMWFFYLFIQQICVKCLRWQHCWMCLNIDTHWWDKIGAPLPSLSVFCQNSNVIEKLKVQASKLQNLSKNSPKVFHWLFFVQNWVTESVNKLQTQNSNQTSESFLLTSLLPLSMMRLNHN